MQKVVVFVDYANIDRAAQEKRVRIDYFHLLNEYLTNQKEGRTLQAASIYVPINPRNEHGRDAAINNLWEAGFVVKTKVGTFAGDSYKCNLDIEMVMDIMKAVYEIKPDILVLASGDVDFVPMVLELRNSGIRVEVAGFDNSTSSLLMERANSFINLDIYYNEYCGVDDPEQEQEQGQEGDYEEAEIENVNNQNEGVQFNLPGQDQ
jgi:uncharacterized LabA/DUF88 family protein